MFLEIDRTISLVDDVPARSEPVRAALEGQGYRVVTTSGAAGAMETVTSQHPDLLILGLDLPDVFGMLEQLAADRAVVPLPVIVILNLRASEADIRQGWKLGIDAYMGVPFNPGELIIYVRRIFRSIDEDERARRKEAYEKSE